MVHTYKTTHVRHKEYHGLSFSVEALTLLAIILCFSVHWILGIISILPMWFVNGYLKYLLDAHATYMYLRRNCGIDISWKEAKKYESYFSPNKTGHWINAQQLCSLPQEDRRDALFAAIADFDVTFGKTDGTDNREKDSPSSIREIDTQ